MRPRVRAAGIGALVMVPAVIYPWNSWRHRFAVLTALATLALVAVGGLVTSHGVGMAVPDWPNTYGYNLFLFPVSRWIGGIFYEHSHRLVASGVGLLTTILALWLYGRKARPFLRWSGSALFILGAAIAWRLPARAADGLVLAVAGLAGVAASCFWPACEPSPRWLRRLGLAAFVAVALQGVLGGLRVVLLKDQIGIAHATLAQLFFVLMCAIALFTSRWWNARAAASGLASPEESRGPGAEEPGAAGSARTLNLRARNWAFLTGTTFLVLLQLVLGATMRHQHAGLAIPDFPLAYGRVWPAMDAAAVAHYNARRMETVAVNPITRAQIGLQMAHRVLAALILGGVTAGACMSRRWFGSRSLPWRLAWAWLGLILLQVLLGAATIWSDKAADIATAHVVGGALSLALGGMLSIISYPVRHPRARVRQVEARPAERRGACAVPGVPALSVSIADLHPVPSAGPVAAPRPSPSIAE